MERRFLRDDAESLVLDADQAGDPSPAVRADQVVAVDQVLATGAVLSDRRRTPSSSCSSAISSWLKRMLPVRARPPGPSAAAPAGSAGGSAAATGSPPPGLIRAARAPALQLDEPAPVIRIGTGEPRVERGRCHLLCRGAALCDRVRNANLVEHLHRALVQDMRLRQVGGLWPRANEQMLDALARRAASTRSDRHRRHRRQHRNALLGAFNERHGASSLSHELGCSLQLEFECTLQLHFRV